jgi:hypothetical protein
MVVSLLADELGANEDFDGLVSCLEDFSMCDPLAESRN